VPSCDGDPTADDEQQEGTSEGITELCHLVPYLEESIGLVLGKGGRRLTDICRKHSVEVKIDTFSKCFWVVGEA